MAKWRRGGGGRRGGRWVIEYVPDNRYTSTSTGGVIYDGEAGPVSQRVGTGCGNGLAAPAGVESCAPVVLEADLTPERAADAETGESIVDG